MSATKHTETETVLREWRVRILNGFLTVAAGIATIMTVATVLDATSNPALWPAVVVYLFLGCVVVALAVFRQIEYRLRAWGTLVVCYLAGLATMATYGLSGAGRLYLLAVPIMTLILIGERAGTIVAGVSAGVMLAFTALARAGLLAALLVRDRNSLLVADWLAEFSDTFGILAVIMALLILFYRFQRRMIDSEARARAALLQAQTLLEEQNATLEQKVLERTSELHASNHSLQQRNAALGILNSVSEAMTKTLDVKALMHLVGDKMRSIFDVDSSMIMLLDRQTNLIHVPYEYDRNEGGYIDYVEPFPLGTGLASRVITSGQPLMANTLEEEVANGAYFPPEIIARGEGSYGESWLGVPILSSDRVLGLIALADNRPHRFNQNHTRLLQTLSSNLGAAIENARLFEAEQARVADLLVINTVQKALASKLDVAAIFELIGEKVQEVFRVDVVDIVSYDPAANLLSMPYSYERGDRSVFTPRPPFGFRLEVIRRREPLLINRNFRELATRYDNPTITGEPPQSALFVPLLVDGQVRYIVSIQDLENEDAFKESDVSLLQTLASSMSIALESARLFGEVRQRAAELATVNTVSSAITSELDLGVLIQLVGEQIRSVFGTDIAYVALLDRDSNMINFPYQYGQELEPIRFGEGLTSRVIESGAPLLINEEMERQREMLRTAAVGRQARSYLGVPICAGGEAVGVISVQSTTEEGIFTAHDLHLLTTIAANVGIALQNARLFREIRRQEQVTREAGEKLRLIFENAFDGISIYEEFPDEDRRVLLECNERYCEIAGRSKQELLSLGDTREIQRSIESATEEQDRASVVAGQAFSGLFSWIRPDGKENFVEYNAAPTRVGDRYFTIGLDRDVTERRRSEEELRRTRAAAEQANQAKSAFLANMSHELRTPLNAIIGFTRIVRRKAEGVLPDKQTENLDKVLVSAEHLLNLINTVLDIAKIEAGRMDVLAANFRVGALVDLCANTAQPLLKPAVVLEKQVDEELTYAYSDQDKIRQIVLNLLSNAAKFTHEGKIVLSARRDGENLRFSVSDTGIGISAEALPRIFKEFQQADNTTTRQYGGTGLGLSISRNLARLLGGELTVESEPGKGSTFTLVVPIHYESRLAAVRVDREAAAVDPTAGRREPGRARKCVLLIDDDRDAVYLLQENLDPQEFEIAGARNGREGLEMARRLRPEAILLDVVMPGADGWQVLRDLKADEATADIPVVFLTIVDNPAFGLELGAAAYLLKPLDPARVRETLDRVIRETKR